MFEAKSLEANESTPLYIQLADQLRDLIQAGGVRSGHAIPSERDLSDQAGASRVTVRKAISQLIAEGLLVRRQGSGTFVSGEIEATGSHLTGFTEEANARGEAADVIWIMKTIAKASKEEILMLELREDEMVLRLGRVRLSGGEPLAIEHAAIPASVIPDVSALESSLYATLEKIGSRPMTGIQKIRASFATQTEAALLSIPEGTEILRIERLTRRGDNKPVEFTRSAYRGDRYVFVNQLRGLYANI